MKNYNRKGSARESLVAGVKDLKVSRNQGQGRREMRLTDKDNILARDKGDADYLTQEDPRGAAGHT